MMFNCEKSYHIAQLHVITHRSSCNDNMCLRVTKYDFRCVEHCCVRNLRQCSIIEEENEFEIDIYMSHEEQENGGLSEGLFYAPFKTYIKFQQHHS